MKNNINQVIEDNLTDSQNKIINRALETKINEDRVIKSITKEVSDFIINLLNIKNDK